MKINISPLGSMLGLSYRHSSMIDALYKFPTSSLCYWYPWNTAYESVLYNDEIILTNTYKAKTEKIKGSHYLNTYVWYNSSVEQDNQRIVDFAKAIGIKSPFEVYTSKDVSEGFELLGKQIDQFCAQQTISLIESDQPYYSSSVGSLEKYALKDLTPPDVHLFAKLGEVYNMLSTMRKVVTINGFA